MPPLASPRPLRGRAVAAAVPAEAGALVAGQVQGLGGSASARAPGAGGPGPRWFVLIRFCTCSVGRWSWEVLSRPIVSKPQSPALRALTVPAALLRPGAQHHGRSGGPGRSLAAVPARGAVLPVCPRVGRPEEPAGQAGRPQSRPG